MSSFRGAPAGAEALCSDAISKASIPLSYPATLPQPPRSRLEIILKMVFYRSAETGAVSDKNHAAVGHNDLSGHVIRVRRRKERRHAHDVLGLRGEAEQDA